MVQAVREWCNKLLMRMKRNPFRDVRHVQGTVVSLASDENNPFLYYLRVQLRSGVEDEVVIDIRSHPLLQGNFDEGLPLAIEIGDTLAYYKEDGPNKRIRGLSIRRRRGTTRVINLSWGADYDFTGRKQ